MNVRAEIIFSAFSIFFSIIVSENKQLVRQRMQQEEELWWKK